eukprot:7275130-Prymnesium_polylepis.1
MDEAQARGASAAVTRTAELFARHGCLLCDSKLRSSRHHPGDRAAASLWCGVPVVRQCPQCRQPVKVVSRNHAIISVVEAFLKAHPDK